jgi:hypothetical protein
MLLYHNYYVLFYFVVNFRDEIQIQSDVVSLVKDIKNKHFLSNTFLYSDHL